MNSPTRYSPEVRERAVRLMLDHQGEHDSQWSAIPSVSSKLGCTAETLRKWVCQAERDRGVRAGLTSEERHRLKELERENRELCAERTRSCARRRRICFPSADINTAIPEPALPQSVRCEPARPSGAGRPAEPALRLTACRGRLVETGGGLDFAIVDTSSPKGQVSTKSGQLHAAVRGPVCPFTHEPVAFPVSATPYARSATPPDFLQSLAYSFECFRR